MPRAPKLDVPCPHCGWYGTRIPEWVAKPGVENPDPNDLSQWHLICTHCGKEFNQKDALKKFIDSGGQYKPLTD